MGREGGSWMGVEGLNTWKTSCGVFPPRECTEDSHPSPSIRSPTRTPPPPRAAS